MIYEPVIDGADVIDARIETRLNSGRGCQIGELLSYSVRALHNDFKVLADRRVIFVGCPVPQIPDSYYAINVAPDLVYRHNRGRIPIVGYQEIVLSL